jgi:hypothetical protein
VVLWFVVLVPGFADAAVPITKVSNAKVAIALGCHVLDEKFQRWIANNPNLGCSARKNGQTWVVYKKIQGAGGSPTLDLSMEGHVLRTYMTE